MLGHVCHDVLKAMALYLVVMKDRVMKHKERPCEPGIMSKSTRTQRKSKEGVELGTTEPVERVYTNVVWSIMILLLGEAKYFIIVDAYSGFPMGRFPAKENGVGNAVINMIQKTENLFNNKIESLSCIH